MSGSLGRDAFAKPVFKTEKVDLPGRGGHLIVREMTSGDALAFYTEISKGKEEGSAASPALWLAYRCVVAESTGERVFSSPDDVGDCLTREELTAINAAVMRVNGMDGETEKKPNAP